MRIEDGDDIHVFPYEEFDPAPIGVRIVVTLQGKGTDDGQALLGEQVELGIEIGQEAVAAFDGCPDIIFDFFTETPWFLTSVFS